MQLIITLKKEGWQTIFYLTKAGASCNINGEMCINLKQSFLCFCIIFSSLGLVDCTSSNRKDYLPPVLDYSFNDLHTKSLSQIKKLLQPSVKEINDQLRSTDQWGGTGNKELDLLATKALIVALSKPSYDSDTDRLVQWVYQKSRGRIPLVQMLHKITMEVVLNINNKRRSPSERATYFYILENIIRELRPWVSQNPLALKTLRYIAKSRIRIPKSVHRERYMKALENRTTSPSEIAQQVLEKAKAGQK